MLLTTILFAISMELGFLYKGDFTLLLKKIGAHSQLEKIANQINENRAFIPTFITIFFNNLSVSFFLLLLGFGLGLIPIFTILINGVLLGATVQFVTQKTGMDPFMVFATFILPHGILELPAIILAASFGIRIGMTVLQRLIAWIHRSSVEKNKVEWRGIRQRFPIIIILIFTFILLAAMIESVLIINI